MHQLAPGNEQIALVVDGNDGARKIFRRLLEMEHYRVLEAGNAVEALRIADTDPSKIRLVLTGVGLPDMDATELVGRLFLAHPKLRFLFLSTGEESDPRIADTGIPVLRGPFTRMGLVKAIARAFSSLPYL